MTEASHPAAPLSPGGLPGDRPAGTAPEPQAPARDAAESLPCVLVVMAVFRPVAGHLRAQIASLAAQDHRPMRLIAVIADTESGPLVEELAGAAGIDCVLVSTGTELDAVRAFEAGVAEAVRLTHGMAPEPLIALCDQDDVWYPDRLSRGVAALQRDPKAQMVHSDARLVAADGTTTIRDSMFAYERRHRNPGLRGLLYRNNVTGMTLLMRLSVARCALPFPPQSGVHFYHDLWLALIAASTGGVKLIRAPLVDYRQHGGNALGAVDRISRQPRTARLPVRMWLRREAAAYALARYLAISLRSRMEEARQDGRLDRPARLKPLKAYTRRMRGIGTHLADSVRLLLGGHGRLAHTAFGFAAVSLARPVWALREALGPGLTEAVEHFDERLFSMSPGVSPPAPPAAPERNGRGRRKGWEGLVDTRKTLGWVPEFSAPAPALTVLVPTLNPTEIFAGIVTALDIGLGIAARGGQVRFVATDLPVASPGASRSFLLQRLPRAEARAAAQRISLHCGMAEAGIPAHRDDVFLATAWWTAHLAAELTGRHGYADPRFLYLIQDYEPNFYAWGQEFADAMASYDLAFDPIFNTTLLRDHFADQGFAFASPVAPAFHPAIDISRYAGPPRPERTAGAPRRLALYGRPEVSRNMFPTAIEALARFVTAEGLGPKDIELVSIGLRHGPVTLPGGLTLTSLGKLPWADYPDYLRQVDLGLSLMYSPHPSHPPIEMAASGVRVVTNSFGPKDLSRLSPAITSTEATAPALAAGLSQAWHAGPLPGSARWIDLGQLGAAPETVIAELAGVLAPRLRIHER